MQPFDPDAAAQPGSGIFGLPHGPDEAAVHVLGVPFDATTSYRRGTAHGPEAVVAASAQVDLYDRLFGKPYEQGIWYRADDGTLAGWNDQARALADPVIAAGGADPDSHEHAHLLAELAALGSRVNERVEEFTTDCLAAERLPVVLGGDHSVPFGAIRAAARAHPGLGVLHFDAHADLRVAFEGFEWSHASIFHNVLEQVPGVASLVQVGIRDLGHAEAMRCDADPRIHTLFDDEWAEVVARGGDRRQAIRRHLERLPQEVWISFDIDGLSPDLCPSTGTPVPGGLDWHQTMQWLEELVLRGHRIVGVDLCEVAPPEGGGDPEGASWDAVVGARLLYRLIGAAMSSRG
jgi:agmatinase